MQVIVVKAYGPYSVGHVIPEMPGAQGRALIARGLVREGKVDLSKRKDPGPANLHRVRVAKAK